MSVQLEMDYCPLYGVAECPLFRGVLMYGETIRTFRIVRYIVGVCR